MRDEREHGPSHSIYVGYLPMPRRHRLFVLIAAPLLVFAVGAIAGAVAAAQRDPGPTEQIAGDDLQRTGTVFMEPYPVLSCDDGYTYLLASTVKAGVADRVSAFDGKRCVLSGTAQARGDRRVLLVSDGHDAIRESSGGVAIPPPVATEARAIRIVGEILDSKCYTGSMKPGNGKAHKACAILCLRGGIAAIVASPDLSGVDTLPLLRVDGSTMLPDDVLELVGERVVITGKLSRVGGIAVLDASVDRIERWSAP